MRFTLHSIILLAIFQLSPQQWQKKSPILGRVRRPDFFMERHACESSSSSSVQQWEYQVFLSFRGEDTRRGFTDHLYAELNRRGITTFRDNPELPRGEVISSELFKAIQGSMFEIIVLSPNYASSTWCLDELQKIVECRNNLGQSMIPVFYGVDPSDVRHQRGSFAEAFRKHGERFEREKEKVQIWRDALKQVVDISGWDSKDRHESELIESIVGDIQRKLQPKLPSYFDNLVGIDSRVERVNSCLGLGSEDVRFIGIWGMGGIGKTTIARVVFERIKGDFDVRAFLENVRDVSDKNGLVNVQRQLLSHLRSIDIYDLYEGKKNIRNLLCKKKVLLVVDDVSELNQLENLAGNLSWFGLGSRVMVTTRDKHLLVAHGVYEDYEVGGLNNDEALELFCRKAFKKEHPGEGYLDLSKEVMKYAAGLPLALEVLGSFLYGRTVDAWHCALTQIKKVPDPKILDTLKICYDALHTLEKNMFLDIACFFKGIHKDHVTETWEKCGLCPGIAIETLSEKSLIKLTGTKHLWMHDLLQEMGRNIVFEESPSNPGKRSRLWSQEDIDRVLVQNKGTDAIQGLFLDLPHQHEACWDPEAFSKTSELKLLKLHNVHPSLGLKFLPSALKVLEWRGCPLKTLPLNNSPHELVDLKMIHSEIEQLWIGIKFMECLRFIDLSFSKKLLRCPDISGVPNLQSLVLEGCTGLVEIHASLGLHSKLIVVNFKDCENLRTLPKKMDMSSLKDLILTGCLKLKTLPEFGDSMERLSTLDASRTSMTKLSQSLGNLVGLDVLSLRDCKQLFCLPNTIQNLKSLKTLDVSGCSKLSKLPEGLKEVKCLENLDASETALEELPSSIFFLENLKMLSFKGCKGPVSQSGNLLLPFKWLFGTRPVSTGFKLPPILGLHSLHSLNLSYCNLSEGSLPSDIGSLSSLRRLNLRGNNFITLPGTICKLSKLQGLFLEYCQKLQSLPELPLAIELLYASNCAALETSQFNPFWPCNLVAATERVRVTGNNYDVKDPVVAIRRFIESIHSPKPRFEMAIPGSEIPSWFDHQNTRFFVTMQLHHSRRPSTELAGFALCFVLVNYVDPKACNHEFFCYFDRCGPGHYPIPFLGSELRLEPCQPHLYIVYMPADQTDISGCSEIEFSLKTECRYGGCYGLEVVKCGCRFLYKEDIEHLKKPSLPKEYLDMICCDQFLTKKCIILHLRVILLSSIILSHYFFHLSCGLVRLCNLNRKSCHDVCKI